MSQATEATGISASCTCGRSRSPVHCVRCGSANCYASNKHSRLYKLEGFDYVAQGYRCRKCGLYFDTAQQCQAPSSREAVQEANRVQVAAQIPQGMKDKILRGLAALGRDVPGYEKPKRQEPGMLEEADAMRDASHETNEQQQSANPPGIHQEPSQDG